MPCQLSVVTMQTDEPERAVGFACTLCNASFGRLEHLQRHTTSARELGLAWK